MELFADILRRCGYRDNVGTRRFIRENERWNSLPMHCEVQVLAALSNFRTLLLLLLVLSKWQWRKEGLHW